MARLEIRCKEAELQDWKSVAEAKGVTLSEFVRSRLGSGVPASGVKQDHIAPTGNSPSVDGHPVFEYTCVRCERFGAAACENCMIAYREWKRAKKKRVSDARAAEPAGHAVCAAGTEGGRFGGSEVLPSVSVEESKGVLRPTDGLGESVAGTGDGGAGTTAEEVGGEEGSGVGASEV